MPWLSYAQNAEDVRLRRAFEGQPKGFYIDVGANHPINDSVTKHFYDIGWTGINVEPSPEPYELIVKHRTRDINLNVGCSDSDGSLTLHVGRGRATGMSTMTDGEAAVHRSKGFEFDVITVPVTTLASICTEHVGDRQIDFLSIDVEGHERAVLEGADFSRFRPRVVVIEATRPNTNEPTHQDREHLIVRHDYEFVVFDGLNRYYVRREDAGLGPKIALAPNVFDDFAPYRYQRQIDELNAELLAFRAANSVLRVMHPVAQGIGWLRRRIAARRG